MESPWDKLLRDLTPEVTLPKVPEESQEGVDVEVPQELVGPLPQAKPKGRRSSKA